MKKRLDDLSEHERHNVASLNKYNRDTDEHMHQHVETKYNKSIHEYYNNLQNPTFKNNSNGMKGVLSRGDGAAGGDLELPSINGGKLQPITTIAGKPLPH